MHDKSNRIKGRINEGHEEQLEIERYKSQL